MGHGYAMSVRRFLTLTDEQKVWWVAHILLSSVETTLDSTVCTRYGHVKVESMASVRLEKGVERAFRLIRESDPPPHVVSYRRGGPYWRELRRQGAFNNVQLEPGSQLYKDLRQLFGPVLRTVREAKRAALQKMYDTGARERPRNAS